MHILSANRCGKKKKRWQQSICTQDMHFHPTARKLYFNKLTLTVCLGNARTTYFIFRNDYLQPFQEGLKEEKERKNRKQPEEKAIPSGP